MVLTVNQSGEVKGLISVAFIHRWLRSVLPIPRNALFRIQYCEQQQRSYWRELLTAAKDRHELNMEESPDEDSFSHALRDEFRFVTESTSKSIDIHIL
jgi:hypothetical protein